MGKKRYKPKKEKFRQYNLKKDLAEGKKIEKEKIRFDTAKMTSSFSSDYMYAGNSQKGKLDVKKGLQDKQRSRVLKSILILFTIILISLILVSDIFIPLSKIVSRNANKTESINSSNDDSVKKATKVMTATKEISKEEYILLRREEEIKEIIKNNTFDNPEAKQNSVKSLNSIKSEIEKLKNTTLKNTKNINTLASIEYKFTFNDDDIIQTSQYIFKTKDLEILSKERFLRTNNPDYMPIAFDKVLDLHKLVYNYTPYVGMKLSTVIDSINKNENTTKFKFTIKEKEADTKVN